MSFSLDSTSHVLGGTSTAGEQLKNPWGCTRKRSFVCQTIENPPGSLKYEKWTELTKSNSQKTKKNKRETTKAD